MEEKDLIQRLKNAAEKTDKSLDEYLTKSNVTKSEMRSISRESLIEILKSISSSGAYLTKPTLNIILAAAGFKKLSSEENKNLKEIWGSRPKGTIKVRPILTADNDELVSEFRETISNLSSKIDKLAEMDTSHNKKNIEEVKKLITDLSSSSNKISAPIKLPAPKDMEIRLVSADSLERMNEYQDDINVFLSLASAFLGAFLGMIGNLLFSSIPIRAPIIAVAALLFIIAIIFAILYKRNNRRSKELRHAFFSSDRGVDLNDYLDNSD